MLPLPRPLLSFRLRFLLAALVISVFFLFLQFYALYSVLTRAPTPTPTLPVAPPPSTPRPAALKYAVLGPVKRFVELMTFLEVPVFVVDPTILQHLLVLNGYPNSRCKFFCQTTGGIVTFGVASNFWFDRSSTYQVREGMSIFDWFDMLTSIYQDS